MSRRLSAGASAEVHNLSDLEDTDGFEMEIEAPNEDTMHGIYTHSTYQHWTRRIFAKVTWRAVISLLLWYSFSISLSVYNKYMFSGEGMDFRFPLLTTTLHQFMQVVLAAVALSIIRLPFNGFPGGHKVRLIAMLASSGDIGLGNSSLLLVTLTFYTMIKSSALGFVLLFSALFGIEQFSWRLAAIIFIMTIGVLMMVFGETHFSILGFLCVLGASCCSGLRWAATKLLLLNDNDDSSEPLPPKKITHPLQAIIAISPGMFLVLLVWGLLMEGPKNFMLAPIWKERPILYSVGLLLFPGILAFGMTWAEFELLNCTGPLTLAVAGICKEVITICVSVGVFHDRLTLINGFGIVVTIMAIALYHYHRIST